MQQPDRQHLARNVAEVRERMAEAALKAGRRPADVQLCAVCKGQPSRLLLDAAGLDIDAFGENRAQEMAVHLGDNAYQGKPCHFIGHLQTNKVRQVVGNAALIHSTDSERLLSAINRAATRLDIVQDVLIQINIGQEATKTGASPDALQPLLDHAGGLTNLRVRGLMAIPPAFDNGPESRRYFALMRALLDKAQAWMPAAPLDILSMGMTDSFEAAILEGATIVRVGRAIFGARL